MEGIKNLDKYRKTQLAYSYEKSRRNRIFLIESQNLIKKLAGLLKREPRNIEIIDIGCGKGPPKVEDLSFSSYIGIDPSERIFRNTATEKTFYIRSVGENLPCKNDAFDVSFLLATLDHFVYSVTGLKEIRRVLKLNGRLYVILGNSFSLRNRVARFIKHRTWDYTHAHFFSTKQVCEMLERLGFSVKELEPSGYLPVPPKIQNIIPDKIAKFLVSTMDKMLSIVLPYNSSYFILKAIKQ